MNTLSPCTPKQATFLASLVASHEVPVHFVGMVDQAKAGALSFRDASSAIDLAMKAPYKKATTTVAALGYYLVGEDVFAVVASKETGKPYAKKLTLAGRRGSWIYAPGAIYNLRPDQRLTVEQAAAMGKQCGCCVVCGRTLTDPDSCARGIGPVCASKL